MSFLFTDVRFLRTFVLLFIMNGICVSFSMFFSYAKHFDLYWFYSFLYREVFFILSCSMFLFLIYHLRLKILQNILLTILTLLTFALFIVDIFLLYNFKSNLSSYLLSVAIDSSRRESVEFLHNYMSFELIFIYLALICLFIFIFVKLKSFKPNKKIVNSLFVLFLFSMILIHVFRLRPVDERWSDLLYNAYASYDQALVSLASLKEAQGLGANFDEIAKDFSSKINAINDEEKIKNIVLLIGESAQRNYMQIYGYDLNSTPKLSQRLSKKPENTFVFKDVISSYVTTHRSLSQVLTLANQDNKQEWHKSFNVMDFFNIISYDTYVLSNQESYGFFSVSITSILNRALNPIFLNKTDKFDNVSFDEVILKNLTKLKKDKASFYAFHLLGSHATYYKRYPKEFDVFSANSTRGGGYCKTIKSQYLNSILYTDFIIDEIIKYFENEDTILIYISDHAEEVCDKSKFFGHTPNQISKFMLEIPFVVYVSDTFKQKHKDLYVRIKNADKSAPYMIDDLMHTLIDLSGVKFEGFEQKRSIFSDDDSFLRQRKRLVGDKYIDYDKELRH